jgi:AcrR family transcriptional regulator
MLFHGAEQVLARNGVSGLTSRAVTSEAGVAKGVMHRHFSDFDAFLAQLVLDRAARLEEPARQLRNAVGTGTVAANLADALTKVFTPLGVAIVALVITRDGLRARLRDAGAPRFPLIAEGLAMVDAYLAEEQAVGRVAATADIPALSPALIGSVHLLFTDSENGTPGKADICRVVSAALRGAS